jgi:hypothetical protein
VYMTEFAIRRSFDDHESNLVHLADVKALDFFPNRISL